jgi:hypothetical protein
VAAVRSRGVEAALQGADLAGDGRAVGGIVGLGHAAELDEAARGRDRDGVEHALLQTGGVALVRHRLDLGGQRGHGQDVGRAKGAAKQQTGRVLDADDDGRLGALVAGREGVREVGDKGELVLDLAVSARGPAGALTITFVRTSATTTDSRTTRSRPDELGSRAKESS